MTITELDDDNPVLHGDDGDTSWMARGVCQEVDPELFFPREGANEKNQTARTLCESCPVLQACRQYAIDRPALDGIWGGTSIKDRQKIRRDRSQPRVKASAVAITDDVIREVVQLRQQMTYAQIAERYGWNVRKVGHVLMVLAPQLGLQVRRDRGRPPTDEALINRIRVMRSNGDSYETISVALEMPRSTVAGICQRNRFAA